MQLIGGRRERAFAVDRVDHLQGVKADLHILIFRMTLSINFAGYQKGSTPSWGSAFNNHALDTPRRPSCSHFAAARSAATPSTAGSIRATASPSPTTTTPSTWGSGRCACSTRI